MDFLPLRLNSSSITCSICALAAIILQLVAMECQKLDMVDSSVVSMNSMINTYFFSQIIGYCKLPLMKSTQALINDKICLHPEILDSRIGCLLVHHSQQNRSVVLQHSQNLPLLQVQN